MWNTARAGKTFLRGVHCDGRMNQEIGKYEISKPGAPMQVGSENFESDGKGQPEMTARYQALKAAGKY